MAGLDGSGRQYFNFPAYEPALYFCSQAFAASSQVSGLAKEAALFWPLWIKGTIVQKHLPAGLL